MTNDPAPAGQPRTWGVRSPRVGVVAVAVLLGLAAIPAIFPVSGNQMTPAAARSTATVPGPSSGYTFRYPAGWYRTAECLPHWCLAAAVSNQPVHDPCTTNGTGTTCTNVLARLRAGALLVEWWGVYSPGDVWSVADLPGLADSIDGVAAKLQEATGSWWGCPADASMSIWVGIGNSTIFSACLRGPGLDLELSTAMAILHSVRFISG